MKFGGILVFGILLGACGHEQMTGNASNGWATPVGSGSVANDDIRRLDPKSPPTVPKRGPARDALREEQAPIDELEAKSGNAPPVDRGSALPPARTTTPDETPPPPAASDMP